MSPPVKPEDEIAAAVARARVKALEQPRDAVAAAVFRARPTDDVEALGITALEQGVMLGWGDEVRSAGRATGERLRAAITGTPGPSLAERYRAHQDTAEAEQAALAARHPLATMGATVAGGLMLGPAAGLRGAAVQAPERLGARLLLNARDGAVLGAVQGSGMAGQGNRLTGGAVGTVAGGVAGAVIPEAIRKGAQGWDWLRSLAPSGAAVPPGPRPPLAPRSPLTPPANASTAVAVREPMLPDSRPTTSLAGVIAGEGEVPALLRRPTAPSAGTAAPVDDMDPRVADYLLKQLGRDQTTPEAALGVLRDRQASGMASARGQRLTELAGVNTRRAAMAVEAQPGEGATILGASAAQSRDRAITAMTEDMQTILGRASQDTRKLLEDLATARKADAAPLYEAAYTAHPGPLTDNPAVMQAKTAIEEAFPDVAEDAARRASRLMIAEGHGNEPVNTVRWFDYYKRGLDNAISARLRAADAGQSLSREEARVLIGKKNAMLGAIDDVVPEFRRARQVFSSETAVMSAMEDAKGLIRKTPDDIRAAFRNAGSEAEREAIRVQMIREADELIRQTAETGDPTKRIARHPFGRDRLMAMMGDDPEKVAALERVLDLQTRTAQTNRVFQGSRTGAVDAARDDLYSGGQADAMATSARQGFLPALRQAGVRRVETWLSGIDETRATALARALAAEDDDAAAVLYQLMRRDQQRRAAAEAAAAGTRRNAGRAGQVVVGAGGAMFGPR